MSHKNIVKIISTHCVQFPGRNMRKLISLYHFLLILLSLLKALVVKNSVLHDFGFGKVSPAKQL